LSVLVSEGWHAGGFFGGDVIDLTANVPSTAGHVRWVVVGIDTTTNALTAINGTSFAGDQNDLVVSEIADIAIPTGVMPLGAVALENGQTAITQGTSWIVDIRRHHAIAGSSSVQVTDNTTTVTANTILFNPSNFVVTDSGGGEAEVEAVTGGATIYAGTVLWETVLSGSGTFDTDNADDEGRTGFSSTYETLVIEYSLRSTAGGTNDIVYMYLNADTTNTNYRTRRVSTAAQTANANLPTIAIATGASSPSNAYTMGQIYIAGYNGGDNKTAYSIDSGRFDTTTLFSLGHYTTYAWTNSTTASAAITRIRIVTDNNPTDKFAAGSYLRIIGYKTRTVGNILNTSNANVSNPPTDAELDSAFGTPASVGNGFAALLDDNGADTNVYLVASNGTSWFYTALTKAT
jgi:hypothetical protein